MIIRDSVSSFTAHNSRNEDFLAASAAYVVHVYTTKLPEIRSKCSDRNYQSCLWAFQPMDHS